MKNAVMKNTKRSSAIALGPQLAKALTIAKPLSNVLMAIPETPKEV